MNKKGLIFAVVIILLIAGFFALRGDDSTVNNPAGDTGTENTGGRDDFAPVTSESTDTTLLGRLKSASVSATESGNRVALSKGSASFTSEGVKGTVVLGDVAVEKTVGGTDYVLATLSVNTGSANTYQYVVLFEDKDGTLTDKSYALLGDRVKVTGLRADEVSGNGAASFVVSVSYLDHDKGENLSSAPTVPRTKILVVENGMFNPAKEINL